jgi:hypothetical protein
MEQTHDGVVASAKIDGATVLEIQAKSKSACQELKLELSTLVRDLATNCFFGIVEIPFGIHRHVVGKGGSNLFKIKEMSEWEGGLIDIVMPIEVDESDEVIIVVKTGCEDLVGRVGDEIVKNATTLADYVVQNLVVDARFHGRLIGTGGERVKEIIGREYANIVVVRLPEAKGGARRHTVDVGPDVVIVRGSSKGVKEVASRIVVLVAEWKHSEILNSFEERVKVQKGLGKKLVNGSSAWLYKAVKEAFAAGGSSKRMASPTESTNVDIKTEVDVDSDELFDILKITGSKAVVEAARCAILEKAKKIEQIAEVRFDIFASVGDDATRALEEAELNQKDIEDSDMIPTRSKVMRRVIGKEGKVIRKLTSRHDVELHFQRADEEDCPSDTVSISGSKVSVEACRIELVEMVEYEVLVDVLTVDYACV